MTRTALNFILLFIVLVLAQAVIFNHLVLFGCAVPLVFLYLLVRLPMSISPTAMLSIGFLLGLSVDVFSDTPGMNTIACTVTAFIRRPVFHFFAPHEDDIMTIQPTSETMGMPAYIKYLLSMVAIYCVAVFTVEAFGFFHPLILLLRAASSTVYTFLLLYAIGSINLRSTHRHI